VLLLAETDSENKVSDDKVSEDESDEDFTPDEHQKLKTTSTPLRNPVPTMKSITMKKVRRHIIIKTIL